MKEPNLGKIDRSMIIERLKSEGVLEDIVNSLQVPPAKATAQTMPVTFAEESLGNSGASDSRGRAAPVT